MSCNYYRGKCLFLNGKEDGCKGCPIKKAYNKGVRDTKKDDRPQGVWIHRRIIAKDRSFDMVVCSNCQTEFSWDAETGVSMDNYKTCPNCTADMRKGGKE